MPFLVHLTFYRPFSFLNVVVIGNLAKYMFLKRCQELELNKTIEFYRLAGQLYDPTKPSGAAGKAHELEVDEEEIFEEN